MATRVTVLGAGFAGLEVATLLSEGLGEKLELKLIDQSESFVFGFSKLDVVFGRSTLDAVRVPYRQIKKPGVEFLHETVTAIDPARRRVTTSGGTYDSDVLIVALGADYDLGATTGLAESGQEFYSLAGAENLRGLLPKFAGDHAIVGATSVPFKCPPAPSEAALLLDDYLSARGIRESCSITLVLPLAAPIPPAPGASKALVAAFGERKIVFLPDKGVTALDVLENQVHLSDGTRLPCDLFLGVPTHRAPQVVVDSGLTVGGWVPVNPATLETRFPGVYAIGDIADIEVPKAGVFAEGAARIVAKAMLARVTGGEPPRPYAGAGSCYVEFGGGQVGRVDVDFLSGPKPTGDFRGPSAALAAEKKEFSASRKRRWFGS